MNEFKAQIDTIWTKFARYVLLDIDEDYYYIEDETSEEITYNIKDHLDEMVADILDIGKSIFEEDDLAPSSCAYFTAKYGILNKIEKFSKKELPLFDVLIHGQSVNTLSETAVGLYLHFLSINNMLPKKLFPHSLMCLEQTKEILSNNVLSYKIVKSNPPTIKLNINELVEALYIGYALTICDPKSPLKSCKNCKKIYYNTNQKSEFCSPKCRNYFNVNSFRRRNN